jgi:hypothetical protein
MRKEYYIKVGNVDNRLVVFINGEMIWDSGIIHNDPSLNKSIPITEYLHEKETYANELILEGFNDTFNTTGSEEDTNPWHFNYRVVEVTLDNSGKVISEKDIVNPYNERHLSNPNIRAMNNSYILKRKGDEYKVISNALSQQFVE